MLAVAHVMGPKNAAGASGNGSNRKWEMLNLCINLSLSIYLSSYLSTYLSINLPIYLSKPLTAQNLTTSGQPCPAPQCLWRSGCLSMVSRHLGLCLVIVLEVILLTWFPDQAGSFHDTAVPDPPSIPWHAPPGRRRARASVFCWNCCSLTASGLAELMPWVMQQGFDVVMIQSTNWSAEEAWQTHGYSPIPSADEARAGGCLLTLIKQTFCLFNHISMCCLGGYNTLDATPAKERLISSMSTNTLRASRKHDHTHSSPGSAYGLSWMDSYAPSHTETFC